MSTHAERKAYLASLKAELRLSRKLTKNVRKQTKLVLDNTAITRELTDVLVTRGPTPVYEGPLDSSLTLVQAVREAVKMAWSERKSDG